MISSLTSSDNNSRSAERSRGLGETGELARELVAPTTVERGLAVFDLPEPTQPPPKLRIIIGAVMAHMGNPGEIIDRFSELAPTDPDRDPWRRVGGGEAVRGYLDGYWAGFTR
jgi:hypothetical protein